MNPNKSRELDHLVTGSNMEAERAEWHWNSVKGLDQGGSTDIGEN